MLVISVVPESSVAGVKICQYVYGHVGVIKESVETVEREPSVWSAVCGGDKELSMLCVYPCC